MAATKRARAVVMAIRMAGEEEGKGNAEEDGVTRRVACDKKVDGNGCKSDGAKGDGRASATSQHK